MTSPFLTGRGDIVLNVGGSESGSWSTEPRKGSTWNTELCATRVYLFLGAGLSTLSAIWGGPPQLASRPLSSFSSVVASDVSLDSPTVKAMIQPSLVTLVGLRTPFVSVCTAVVCGRTMTQLLSATPGGHVGAASGELEVCP